MIHAGGSFEVITSYSFLSVPSAQKKACSYWYELLVHKCCLPMNLLANSRDQSKSFPRLQFKRLSKFLGRAVCDPLVCGATRTSISDSAIGGSVRPLTKTQPTKPQRWRRAVSLSLPSKITVSASTWEHDNGEGTFTWRRRTTRILRKRGRKRRIRHAHPISTEVHSRRQNKLSQILPDGAAYFNGAFQDAIEGLSFNLPLTKPLSMLLPRRKSSSLPRFDRNLRVEVKKTGRRNSFIFAINDTEHGHASISFEPKMRFFSSVSVRDSMLRTHRSRSRKFRRLEKGAAEQDTRSIRLKSDVEYKWKENKFVVTSGIEALGGSAQVRTTTNPIRVTPRIQLPLGRGGRNAPYICWSPEPKSKIGEIRLEWKGILVSTDWACSSLTVRKKSSDGGFSSVSLNSERVLKLDQTVISKQLRGETLVTLNSTVSNKNDSTGASISAEGSWGTIFANARTSMACDVGVDAHLRSKRHKYTIRFTMENWAHAALRFGIFY